MLSLKLKWICMKFWELNVCLVGKGSSCILTNVRDAEKMSNELWRTLLCGHHGICDLQIYDSQLP